MTINFFRIAGYNKAVITFFKYIPQVYLNFKRKSTVGWSILNITLDFTGGVFSIAQQAIDMTYNGVNGKGWNFFGNDDGFNIVKFCLGVFSIFFDVIFMVQHYILYREVEDAQDAEVKIATKHAPFLDEPDELELPDSVWVTDNKLKEPPSIK